jgi:hypothetical protein
MAVNAAVVADVANGVTVSSSLPVPISLLSSVPCTCTLLTGAFVATLAVGLVVADQPEGAFGVVVDDPIDLLVRAALSGGGSFFLVEGRGRFWVPARCLAMPFGGDIVGRYQNYELKWLVKSDLCHPKNSVVCTGILWYKAQNFLGCTGFRV